MEGGGRPAPGRPPLAGAFHLTQEASRARKEILKAQMESLERELRRTTMLEDVARLGGGDNFEVLRNMEKKEQRKSEEAGTDEPKRPTAPPDPADSKPNRAPTAVLPALPASPSQPQIAPPPAAGSAPASALAPECPVHFLFLFMT